MIHATRAALILAALLPITAFGPRAGPDPLPGSAATAGPPAIDWMTVEIWPEYDDPRVLVIYRGTLAPSTEPPVDFSFVIPAGAQIHMAGGIAPDGGHMHGSYETVAREDGLMEVSYRLEVPDFYMEFYYDPLSGAEERSFTYPVVSSYDVPSLAVSVQEPRRAEGFQLSPNTREVVQDDRGFDYHVVRWTDVAAGASSPVTVAYRKADRRPSMAAPEAAGGSAPTAGGSAVTGAGSGGAAGAPWGRLPAILAVLLASAGTYLVVLGWLRPEPAEGGEAGRPAPPPEPVTPPDAVPRFCSHCGKGITSRDRYCAWCGERTRVTGAMEMAGT